MTTSIVNFGVKQYLAFRYQRIRDMRDNAPELQYKWLKKLLKQAEPTSYGTQLGLSEDLTYHLFARRVPAMHYEEYYPFIESMMLGKSNILTPGVTTYFAKSSGTTNDKHKYIPVNKGMIDSNFITSSWDSMNIIYHQRPETRIFADKSLLIGGSLESFPKFPNTIVGDVSAIMIDQMPAIGRPFFTPDFTTATMSDFELKMKEMARITSKEDVVMFGGVPTWSIVLFQHILDYTGKKNMQEVWPNAKTYMHGGVGFSPYRAQFDKYFPDGIDYLEIYNASEGYIAMQDDYEDDGLLLMVDNGIFFEFITLEDYQNQNWNAILPLEGVKEGRTYVLIMSSINGLWRYIPGDTIVFTQLAPYKIRVAGRTKQCLNVFGEEVMVSNTDQALANTCQKFGVIAKDYTVTPKHLTAKQKGRHDWIIEFLDKCPVNLDLFGEVLDQELQSLNGDYAAKRVKDMALTQLQITQVPLGTFQSWLQSRGRTGSQVKVPRLSEEGQYYREILNLAISKS